MTADRTNIVAFASVKGAPGVTTTACLVGATWPAGRRAVVAECDPFGGDLVPRFALSSRSGWNTVATATRRGGADTPLHAHLQELPGGLEVLTAMRPSAAGSVESHSVQVIEALCTGMAAPTVLVDVGRLLPGPLDSRGWLARADMVALVLRPDVASVMHVSERAPELLAVCGERIGLVLVGEGEHSASEVAGFVGLPLTGQLPFDTVASSVLAGGRGSVRRLRRSSLTASAVRLAETLSGRCSSTAPRWEPTRSVTA